MVNIASSNPKASRVYARVQVLRVLLSDDLPEFYMDDATILLVAWCAAAKTWIRLRDLRRRRSVTVMS